MRPANERQRYIVTSSLIGWTHTQNDPCMSEDIFPWQQFLVSHVAGKSKSIAVHGMRGGDQLGWLSLGCGERYWDINTLRPRQNVRHFPEDIFKCIFLNENVWILIKISLKFVPKGPINNILALVQIMARHRTGNKPLSEPVMGILLTHICITQPQWVNSMVPERSECDFKSEVIMFSLLLLIGIFRSYENAIKWMPQDLTDDKLTLAQVMA